MDSIINECAGDGILIQTSPKEVRPMPNQMGVGQVVTGHQRKRNNTEGKMFVVVWGSGSLLVSGKC